MSSHISISVLLNCTIRGCVNESQTERQRQGDREREQRDRKRQRKLSCYPQGISPSFGYIIYYSVYISGQKVTKQTEKIQIP